MNSFVEKYAKIYFKSLLLYNMTGLYVNYDDMCDTHEIAYYLTHKFI